MLGQCKSYCKRFIWTARLSIFWISVKQMLSDTQHNMASILECLHHRHLLLTCSHQEGWPWQVCRRDAIYKSHDGDTRIGHRISLPYQSAWFPCSFLRSILPCSQTCSPPTNQTSLRLSVEATLCNLQSPFCLWFEKWKKWLHHYSKQRPKQ